MSAHPFDTNEDGSVITRPLIGYDTAPVGGMFVLTRLQYAESPNQLSAIMAGTVKPPALQLAITPDQADALAQRLMELAAHIRSQKTPSQPSRN
ncbi:hypothetical protein [Paracoccus laeviglucosivorans]|uniref:hypothetical protein n=1 Tax=Paracoccus laeviglucosivorans TaxID=1197861 RepID=UPI0011586F52|nr:hypothetical protein [Paracoccus laeviglucosivorans]